MVTVQDHGNTSAASIPLALSVGKARGQIKQGDLVVVEAIGGGLACDAGEAGGPPEEPCVTVMPDLLGAPILHSSSGTCRVVDWRCARANWWRDHSGVRPCP